MKTQSLLIYDYSLPDLSKLLANWGEPSYRAKQIWTGLYKHLYQSPIQFTNLPKTLRAKLDNNFEFHAFTPITTLETSDRLTVKTLLKLGDGNLIEAVLMRYGDPADYHNEQDSPRRTESKFRLRKVNSRPNSEANQRNKIRRTLCISSQAGCAMGCVFCATGQMGFKRNLSSGEILSQVLYYARILHENGQRVTNVVLMGMGEPFHNYDNVLAAIDRLNDSDGFGLGARRFTISTVGLVPAIRRFADEKRQVNLAISLHNSDDQSRSEIIPINNKWNIDELLEACRYYTQKSKRRVTFEWALINGVNDSENAAADLALRLKGILCHVNAIPLNPTMGYKGQASSNLRAKRFKEVLEHGGIPCTIRLRRGIDIQAGCGQLAGFVFFK